jgi:hypothetical protein
VQLAEALSARRTAPPLVPEQPWIGLPAGLFEGASPPAALRWAAAVIADRPVDAVAGTVEEEEAAVWRAVALRRAGRFREARRAFRELSAHPTASPLFEAALTVLRGAGAGYRWATEAADHLMVRGSWDPVWFVDACAAVHAGLLSRETAALLEEIQRFELKLLVEAGGAV